MFLVCLSFWVYNIKFKYTPNPNIITARSMLMLNDFNSYKTKIFCIIKNNIRLS